MIKFRDAMGNTVYSRAEDIKTLVRAHPLAKGPDGRTPMPSMIFCMGTQSIVDDRTIEEVLKQLGESLLAH